MQMCLASLLSNGDIRRLPRPNLIAQEIDDGTNGSLGRGSALYREYLQRYRQQGSPKKLLRANADFVAALDCMKVLRPNPFGSYDVKAARYAVARATGRSLSETRELVGSVTRFRRIVELAKAKVLDLTPAEVRALKKLGGIYDHWPDLLPRKLVLSEAILPGILNSHAVQSADSAPGLDQNCAPQVSPPSRTSGSYATSAIFTPWATITTCC